MDFNFNAERQVPKTLKRYILIEDMSTVNKDAHFLEEFDTFGEAMRRKDQRDAENHEAGEDDDNTAVYERCNQNA